MKLSAVSLAVCDSLRNKTFACRAKNELITVFSLSFSSAGKGEFLTGIFYFNNL